MLHKLKDIQNDFTEIHQALDELMFECFVFSIFIIILFCVLIVRVNSFYADMFKQNAYILKEINYEVEQINKTIDKSVERLNAND